MFYDKKNTKKEKNQIFRPLRGKEETLLFKKKQKEKTGGRGEQGGHVTKTRERRQDGWWD